LQLLEIAIIEKPADHARRDLPRGVLIELVSRQELESSIGTVQRCFLSSKEKVARFYHGHTGAIGTAVG